MSQFLDINDHRANNDVKGTFSFLTLANNNVNTLTFQEEVIGAYSSVRDMNMKRNEMIKSILQSLPQDEYISFVETHETKGKGHNVLTITYTFKSEKINTILLIRIYTNDYDEIYPLTPQLPALNSKVSNILMNYFR